jgi:hypothetical protein
VDAVHAAFQRLEERDQVAQVLLLGGGPAALTRSATSGRSSPGG